MAFPVIPILSELIGMGRQWLQGKQVIQAAKDERAAELIKQTGTWEEIMAQGSTTSWKDEYLTIVVSIPMILAFFPPATQYVLQGFVVLDNMPEWYRYTLGVVVSATFGVKKVQEYFGAKKANG